MAPDENKELDDQIVQGEEVLLSTQALDIAEKSIALDEAITKRKGAEGKVAFARRELDLALAYETIAHQVYLESLDKSTCSSTEADSPSDMPPPE